MKVNKGERDAACKSIATGASSGRITSYKRGMKSFRSR